MSGRQLAGSVFACQLILLCCFVAFARNRGELGAANPQVATAPPDLSGVWTRIRVGAGHRDDAPAMTPWAESKYKSARAASADPLAELTDTSFSCIPPGVPRIYDQAPPFEIIQVPGRVIM